mgnify:CR=1 FL=1
MDPILNTNEYTEVDGRQYLNPQVALDESNKFIDNLRSTQTQQNQQIAQDTYNLGLALPSAQGGLGTNTASNMGYFTSRYQTPQTNAAVANLRAAAQAAALNQALQNEQEIWKKKYQDAYRNYQKRMNDKANQPVIQNPYVDVPGDDPEKQTTTPEGSNETSIGGFPGTYTVTDIAGNLHVVDMNTGDEESIAPGQSSKTWTSADGIGGGVMRTLPNGNKVWVRPGYGLTKDNGRYYLVNQSTGARTEVGGY